MTVWKSDTAMSRNVTVDLSPESPRGLSTPEDAVWKARGLRGVTHTLEHPPLLRDSGGGDKLQVSTRIVGPAHAYAKRRR